MVDLIVGFWLGVVACWAAQILGCWIDGRRKRKTIYSARILRIQKAHQQRNKEADKKVLPKRQ